jgi:hypothetical protein
LNNFLREKRCLQKEHTSQAPQSVKERMASELEWLQLVEEKLLTLEEQKAVRE